ncbi:hypothetical protein NN561_002000 [Cricetulus griseus]
MGKADVRETQPRGGGVTGSSCSPSPGLRVLTAGDRHRCSLVEWLGVAGGSRQAKDGGLGEELSGPLSSNSLRPFHLSRPLHLGSRRTPSHLGVTVRERPTTCVRTPGPGPGGCAIGPSDPARQLPPPQR